MQGGLVDAVVVGHEPEPRHHASGLLRGKHVVVDAHRLEALINTDAPHHLALVVVHEPATVRQCRNTAVHEVTGRLGSHVLIGEPMRRLQEVFLIEQVLQLL